MFDEKLEKKPNGLLVSNYSQKGDIVSFMSHLVKMVSILFFFSLFKNVV